MPKYTKQDAIRIATSCARKYEEELMDRILLFICQDKHRRTSYIEFSFNRWNFMHLTGLKVNRHGGSLETDKDENIAANDFFDKCLNHKLSPDDFEFSQDGTTHLKLDVLSGLLCKNLSASMIGEYNSAKPRLYTEKLAGGAKACMGFVIDSVSGQYVPNTVLKEDLRDNVRDYRRVIAVYRKRKGDKEYHELTYKAKKVDWSEVTYPDELSYLTVQKPDKV